MHVRDFSPMGQSQASGLTRHCRVAWLTLGVFEHECSASQGPCRFLRLASSAVSGGGLTIVRKIGCCKFTAYRRFRTDRRKQRRPNRSGPLTRTALHEFKTYNSPVFRFRQVANWHTLDRPPALLRDVASHDHGRRRGAPMVRACGPGRRGYNNSSTNPAGSFRFAIIRQATTSVIPLIAATTTKKVFWSVANSIATLIPKLYRSPMRKRAGSGCLDRFPRTISGVLPGLLSLPHRGWDEGRA